jgi:hypothetical protein
MSTLADAARQSFIQDLVHGLRAHRHRTSTVIWPDHGEEVADQLSADVDSGTLSTAEQLAAALGAELDCAVTARSENAPFEVHGSAEAVVLTVRGSCHVVAGGRKPIRLLAGEAVYQVAGQELRVGDLHDDCSLLVMTLSKAP